MQLQHGRLILGLHYRRQAGVALDVVVGDDAELTLTDLAACLHITSGGHDQPEAAACAHAQPTQLIVGHPPVDGGLIAGHRRQHQAVEHGRAALERERL